MYAGPRLGEDAPHAFDHRVGDGVEVPVHALAVVDEDVERGVHAGQGHGVAAVGAAMEHDAVGLQLHDLLLAAERGGARRPAPTALAMQVMSGMTPYSSWAPPSETRKPVMILSKMSTTSFSSQMRRSPSRNPGTGSHAGIAEDRLGQDTGQRLAVVLDEHLDRVDVVERRNDHRVVEGLGCGLEGQRARDFSVPAAPRASTCEKA